MRHRLWANDPKAFRKTDQEQPAIPMWNAPPSVLATFAVIKEFRTEIKLAISSLDFLMIPLFTELCKRRGMDVSDVLSHYYVDDIVRLIEGNPLSDAELSRRKEAQLLIFERGAIRRYSGIEASSIFEQFAPKIDGSRIVGQVASRGKERFVYGDALCISDLPSARRAARDNVSPSSIVVTSMTQFNELDFLTRSAGIVTDEGGVLSHAAVIAREFGVPCIVGTRTARSLVQDGARLVMDMDRGVVRVISELE
jgi:phosphohistidine swiveling domain-containing protein